MAKPVYLYYFGDYDPSGVDISRHIEERLRALAPDAEIHFIRVAVNQDQIAEMNLPTRPTKPTDSRSKKFAGESVEVDAIDPHRLRAMVHQVIRRHIDPDELSRLQSIEAAERATLAQMAAIIREGNAPRRRPRRSAGREPL
jgi:hypothetical protein